MKISLAQMDVVAGRPDNNVDKMLNWIKEAKQNKCDAICFPEMCVGGYLVGDKWTDDSFCSDLMSYNDVLCDASDDIVVIYGNIFVDGDKEGWHPNQDGRSRKYNAAYIFQNKKPVKRVRDDLFLGCNGYRKIPQGVQPKTNLPNYRFFDDERYFSSFIDLIRDFDGNVNIQDYYQPFVLTIKGKKINIGITLCEDMWCKDYRLKRKSVDPTRYFISNGAEMIFNLSASPWTFEKHIARNNRIVEIKKDLEKEERSFVPFYYVNCVGAQNNGKNIITFDGGTTVYNKDAQICDNMHDRPFQEGTLVTENKLIKNTKTIEQPKIEQKFNAVIRGLKHMKNMLGTEEYPKFVIGLSGGVDSSLSAALLVLSIGADKVIGINMPSEYNSQKTKNTAEKLAKNLGIEYRIVPLTDIASSVNKALGDNRKNLVEENEQARIRGSIILAGVAARENALFVNNGNKIETLLGYATIYGDVNGAIAPLGDLTKVEIFEMVRYINKEIYGKEVIPEILLPDENFIFDETKIFPSAELAVNQKDPIKFGYHDALVEKIMDYRKTSPENFMEWWLNGELHKKLGISLRLLKHYNLDDPKMFIRDLEWVFKFMQRSVFKRIQSPPIIITSKTSFGFDLRESQMPFIKSERYKILEKKVLAAQRYGV